MSVATKSINKFKMIYEDIKNNENNDINYEYKRKNSNEEDNLNEIKLVNNVKKFIKFKKKFVK
jgi:hypothetical protein